MFKKILIANRGEIATRIIRTCEELEIDSIAIYSDVDRLSPHVLKAKEAYCVGSAPSSKSYLNTKKILSIIKEKNIDAVHPGYGFLSENYYFADEIKKIGVNWIGPSPESIKIMGDKILARSLAHSVGAPLIPGTNKAINDLNRALEAAQKIGFPVLIKAAGGGGGKGMRKVNTEKEFKMAISRAQSEAKNSFSDSRVYIEKFLEDPHHIEIQIFADNYGNVVSLGERECSIQRRYQKIIEEAPSPFINNSLRKSLSEIAIKITKACKYSGAGTVEFLVDKHKNFYFLEMNTRLQVEHPITESVTNIDLVKEQISVAAGEKLSFTQDEVQITGHSIECRIYAENGFENFLPSTGYISDMIIPQGIGVRFDEGIRINQKITPFYDPLIGKLITWGPDRRTAIQRMIRSLNEFYISGVITTIPFCLMIINHKLFKNGIYSTLTLDNIYDEILSENKIAQKNIIIPMSIAAAFHSGSSNKNKIVQKEKREKSTWKEQGDKNCLR